jgi:acyl-CoA dehydrogenase
MYRAPVDEIAHTLKSVAGLRKALETQRFGDLGEDLVDAILADGKVTTPPGWRDAYRGWIAGGWNGLTADPEFGGQGLPQMLLSAAAMEMWNSGSMAFGIGPTLTIGAVEAMEKHASAELKAKYLEKLVSGEWMGTMNLTEPQAGSDLNALKARAERNGDGTYRIFGQKIFITYGEHDLTDNIVHLVLARLPDAPAGTRAFRCSWCRSSLSATTARLGARNDVFCRRPRAQARHSRLADLHHDLRRRSSGGRHRLADRRGEPGPCLHVHDDEQRPPRRRHAGVAVAERAYQQALAYALERKQGRAPGDTGEGMSPIIAIPMSRMLMTMKALTQAARDLLRLRPRASTWPMCVGGGGQAKFWPNAPAC